MCISAALLILPEQAITTVSAAFDPVFTAEHVVSSRMPKAKAWLNAGAGGMVGYAADRQ